MIIKTLEECVEIFNKMKRVRDDREFSSSLTSFNELEKEIGASEFEIFEVENIHKRLIKNIASQTQGLDDVLEYMKDTNKDIVGQAFLVIVESKNEIVIQKMIEKYLFDKDRRSKIFQYLVYVSED